MLSVITPFFNRYDLFRVLLDHLDSIKLEGELIVVDDFSAPEISRKILEVLEEPHCFGTQYKRLPKNCGPSVCRNEGLSLSRYDYVIFLDSDDFISAERVKKHMAFLKENADFDFVYSTNYCVWYLHENEIEIKERKNFVSWSAENFCFFLNKKKLVDFPHTAALTIRKKCLLDKNIYFDPRLRSSEDTLFKFLMLIRDLRYAEIDIDAPGLYLNTNLGSITRRPRRGFSVVNYRNKITSALLMMRFKQPSNFRYSVMIYLVINTKKLLRTFVKENLVA